MAPKPVTEAQRFWSKVLLPLDTNGCMLWTAYVKPDGYGLFQIWRDGRSTTSHAHRIAWELCNGSVPPGLSVDHLCNNRACVRPDHLEPVSHEENIRRRYQRRPLKRYCLNGHERILENLTSNRSCRLCQKDYDRGRKHHA